MITIDRDDSMAKKSSRRRKLIEYEESSGAGKKLRNVSLLYFVDDKKKRVLLAMKKRGFGAGLLNGVGGKQKEGETIEKAAVREAKEEVGMVPVKYEKAGSIRFYFDGDKKDLFNQNVTVFIAKRWRGNPVESEEMSPKWFHINKLPYDKMWLDDRYWLQKVIEGKKIDAAFLFGGKNYNEIIDLSISFY
jgi:8-oxo-dGTP pyrophosphatase MutT (NUDIX family)